MCGIVGIIQLQGHPVAQDDLLAATSCLAHRGPDDAGHLATGNLGLGHRRLAIFDPGDRGRQPMQYKHLTIVFNGAIYNFPELRAELLAAGHQFRSHTDTEVILAAWDEWGPDCLHRFRGMWAFLIHDTRRQTLLASRDRFGIKPLYYGQTGEEMLLTSELKVFTSRPGFRSRLRPARVYEWLHHGWQDHSADGWYEAIRQLPPGSTLEIDLNSGQQTLQRWYDVRPKELLRESDLSPEEAAVLLRGQLQDSVELCMRSDVGRALTLSGGLDSSTIAGLMRRQQPDGPIDAFAALFPGTAYDESAYVKEAVEYNRLQLHSLLPDWSSFQAWLPATLAAQDEPLASAAVVGHFELMDRVRQSGHRLLLNGQGADEILAGYNKFFLTHLREMNRIGQLRELLFMLRRGSISLSVLKQKLGQQRVAAPWAQPGFLPYGRIEREEALTTREVSLQLLGGVGLPVLLRHEDRNAMAHGIETRPPFLDHPLVELALRLPDAWKIRDGQRKYLLREAARPWLPDKIYRRYDKLGFATPQKDWMAAHPDFFLPVIGRTADRFPVIFTPQTLKWSREVLHARRYAAFPAVWRIWAFGRWAESRNVN